MRKKIFAALVAVMLVAGLVPVLSFGMVASYLMVDGMNLDTDVNGALIDQEGDHWAYADGVLTLDGYAGQEIRLSPDGVGVPETLTIVLKGQNTISEGWRGVSSRSGGSFIFQGDGTLEIKNVNGNSFPAIYAESGTVTFDLSPGGEVRMDPIKAVMPMAEPNLPPWMLDTPIAIVAGDYDQDTELYSATTDMITLKAGNIITSPEGQTISLYTWDVAALQDEEGATLAEPAAAAKAEESMATILDADGKLPASAVTITGVALPEEEPAPEVTPAAPGTVAPAKTPKTGDSSMAGIMMILMAAGAATAIGVAKRKFDC